MEPQLEEGEVLAGKFRIERCLGRGGMGVVYAAHHLQLDEPVAIKLLLPEVAKDRDAISRFMREARAAVKVKSEHVARVIDVAKLDDGSPYMVMEYLRGHDLGGEVRGATLPVQQAVGYVLEAIDAIAEAHALGIVHRDLKPSNLFLAERTDGTTAVKVLDFGISKMRSRTGLKPDTMTKSTALLGSPLYMPPEQMESTRDVDGRADIWSLGAILFELLTGRPPFEADTLPVLFSRVLNEEAQPLRSLRPEVSPELDAVVLRCLQKRPEDRFQSVAQLADELVPFGPPDGRAHAERANRLLEGISTSSLQRRARAVETTLPAGKTGWSWLSGGTAKPTGRGPWMALGGVVVGVALSAAVAFGLMAGRSGKGTPGDFPGPVAPSASSTAAPVMSSAPDATPAGSASASTAASVSAAASVPPRMPSTAKPADSPTPIPGPPTTPPARTTAKPPAVPPSPTPGVPDYGDRK